MCVCLYLDKLQFIAYQIEFISMEWKFENDEVGYVLFILYGKQPANNFAKQ